jgi:hypothetical protein
MPTGWASIAARRGLGTMGGEHVVDTSIAAGTVKYRRTGEPKKTAPAVGHLGDRLRRRRGGATRDVWGALFRSLFFCRRVAERQDHLWRGSHISLLGDTILRFCYCPRCDRVHGTRTLPRFTRKVCFVCRRSVRVLLRSRRRDGRRICNGAERLVCADANDRRPRSGSSVIPHLPTRFPRLAPRTSRCATERATGRRSLNETRDAHREVRGPAL